MICCFRSEFSLGICGYISFKIPVNILQQYVLKVVPRGFEPRQTESKSVVLPLYYGTKMTRYLSGCKNKGIQEVCKTQF